MITKEIILEELKVWNEYDIEFLKQLSEKELLKVWNAHLQRYSKEIPIIEVIENYKDEMILVDTPDGYQPVGNFYIKKPRLIYTIKTKDNRTAKVSEDHLFETSKGWKKAKDLLDEKNIELLTKSGFVKIKSITISKKETVYDWEILHENHRYWTASGISSHNTGKTFLALNMCREAQQKGYHIIYCDSEAAVDQDVFEKFGIDPNKVRYQPVTTVQEFTTFVNNLLKMLKEAKKEKKKTPKIFLVLDSLGNLASSKEKEDAVTGSTARDMTKQQVIRSLFRTITVDLAEEKIPFVITNHTYQGMGLFAKREISGGGGIIFNSSIIIMLSKAQLKEGIDVAKKAEMKSTGIIVTSTPIKNRFARPIPIRFHISVFKGMNKYTGLEKYINWETCGIERGNLLNEKEYQKLDKQIKEKYSEEIYSWEYKNTETGKTEKLWFIPKPTARYFVVKHLNKKIEPKKLFTPEVFTEEILRQIDEKAIKPLFMLPDIKSLDDFIDIGNDIDDILTDEEE